MIDTVTVTGGHGKDGAADKVQRIDMHMGDIISIVGPTGSGKTTFINDIELFADGDTPSGRRVLIDGKTPPPIYKDDPSLNPIALITQHTNFLSDLPVDTFLSIHAEIRCGENRTVADAVERTIDFANQLTGEPVQPGVRMTELSGGQTRALLIADATIICDTPIVLLDEVENAGIYRTKALELLRRQKKIFIFVTHDPRIALLSDFRIVMSGGSVQNLIYASETERHFAKKVNMLDDLMCSLRESIRSGGTLGGDMPAYFMNLMALQTEAGK